MGAGFTLEELARLAGGRVRGDPARRVSGVAVLEAAGENDLSFLTNRKYRDAARRSRAGAILTAPGADLPNRDLIEADAPYPALAAILARMYPAARPAAGVSPDARIARDATLGAEVAIGPFAVVGAGCAVGDRAAIGAGAVLGEGCAIGADTVVHARAVLYPGTRVGARCIVHSGAVLGADGFGFATTGGEHRKIPQLGRVVVEDDVEIGANTTIDRAMLGETVVGRGSKIDDLVMIAHGVVVGAHALLAAQSGIAGSTRLGRNVTLAGQSGAAGHLVLGDRAVVAAKSAVFHDLGEEAFVAGIPAIDHRAWKRAQAVVKALPKLKGELNALARRIEALEGRGEGEP